MQNEKSNVKSTIDSLENIEKALMEQLSKTTQKRDEKMQIIRTINNGVKVNWTYIKITFRFITFNT